MSHLVLASWNLAQAWNPDRTPSPWDYLRRLVEDHGVQVFALQEAAPPTVNVAHSVPPADDPELWRLPIPRSQRRFCSAVVSLDDTLEFEPRRSVPIPDAAYGQFFACHPGQFSVADVILESGARVTIVSLYGMWDRIGEAGDLYADASLHRAISDLAPIFGERASGNIVVTGDLNIWHAYDQATSIRNWSAEWAHRFRVVFDRFAAHGLNLVGPFRDAAEPLLEGCPCNSGVECRHVNTYLHNRDSKNVPYQNDFVFTTKSIGVSKCYAVQDDAIWQHSDHRPVVAVLDIPHTEAHLSSRPSSGNSVNGHQCHLASWGSMAQPAMWDSGEAHCAEGGSRSHSAPSGRARRLRSAKPWRTRP